MTQLFLSQFGTSELRRIVKFASVGLMSVAVYFVILFALVRVVSSTVLLAAIAYIGSAFFNYVLQRNFTFESHLSNSVSFRRYVAMHALTMTVNSALMFVLVDVLIVNLYLAQSIVIIIVAITNYLLSRYWVYR